MGEKGGDGGIEGVTKGREGSGDSNDEPWGIMTEGRMDRQTEKLEQKG